MASKMAQDSPRCLKMAPNMLQEAPRTLQDAALAPGVCKISAARAPQLNWHGLNSHGLDSHGLDSHRTGLART